MAEHEIQNKQCVAMRGDSIIIILPKFLMTRDEALMHAAWLVALADYEDKFPAMLQAVQNT